MRVCDETRIRRQDRRATVWKRYALIIRDRMLAVKADAGESYLEAIGPCTECEYLREELREMQREISAAARGGYQEGYEQGYERGRSEGEY